MALLGLGWVSAPAAGDVCTVAADCQAGTPETSGGAFYQPWGVTTNSAGAVFVSEFGALNNNGRIQKFDSSGNFLRAWGKDVDVGGGTGAEICTVASRCQTGSSGGTGGEFTAPLGVVADSSDNIYAAEAGTNNRIQKFDSAGNFLRAWGKDVDVGGGTDFEVCTVALQCKSGPAGTLGGEIYGALGAAIGPGGSLYVTEVSLPAFTDARVQKFDTSGNFLRAWGKDVLAGGGSGFEICTVAASCQRGLIGSLGGELSFASGVATDSGGNVYVAEATNNRIEKFDASGNFLLAWGQDVDAANPGTGFEVCAVAADCKAGAPGGLGGELKSPYGLAIDQGDHVYAAEYGNNRIQEFDSSGNFIRAWGGDVDGANPATGPEVCAVALDCKAGAAGGLGGEMKGPVGIAIDPSENIYVVDQGNYRVQKFDSSGAFLRVWGGEVTAPPDTAPPNTLINSGPAGAIVDATPTFSFAATEPGSTFSCSIDTGAPAFVPCSGPGDTHTPASPLPAGTYNFRVRASDPSSNEDPTPAVRRFTVLADGPPDFGKTADSSPVTGTIKVKLPGTNRFVILRAGQSIPIGSVLDARKGTVHIVSSDGQGGVREVDFRAGVFKLRQGKATQGYTDAQLVPGIGCRTVGREALPSAGSATQSNRRKRRGKGNRLWGKGKGKHRTTGSGSDASVGGTEWLVWNRCDGSTLTRVKSGVVVVRDFRTGRRITLKAGQSYVAKPRRRR